MAISLQFKYTARCHCGDHWEGEAGRFATGDIPKRYEEFFKEHKDCQPKKKQRKVKMKVRVKKNLVNERKL